MASPKPGHIVALPFDVLAHISSFIRIVPRLRVVSLLSKRWRSVVLLSLKQIELSHEDPCKNGYRLCNFPLVLSYVSSVTSLGLRPCTRSKSLAISLPTSLTDLTVRGEKENELKLCGPLPALVSLSISIHGAQGCVGLLEASISTLSSLQLRPMSGIYTDAVSSFLKVTRFPSLHSLDLTAPSTYPWSVNKNSPRCFSDIVVFLATHATQLTELEVSGIHCGHGSGSDSDFPEPLSVLQYPNLTKLALRWWRNLTKVQLERLLSHCPRLKAFTCDSLPVLHQVEPLALLSSLTELSPHQNTMYPFELLSRYLPTLKEIGYLCMSKDGAGAQLLADLLDKHYEDMVPFLFLDKGVPGADLIPSALQRCTRLTGLCLEGYQSDPFATESLPPTLRLQTFSFTMIDDLPLKFIIQIVQQALTRCPALEFLAFELPPRKSEKLLLSEAQFVEAIKPLFVEIERRAIESVTVSTSDVDLVKPLVERAVHLGWTKIGVGEKGEDQ